MRIDFGEWLPDQPALDNPGCIQAVNVIPRAQSYGQLRDVKAFSGALSSACLGAAWFPDIAGNAHNFAGDVDKLYKYTNTSATWANVSRTATYSTATQWSFEKFGNRIISVDIGNAPQVFVMGSSATFANLGGSPPSAKYVAAVRDFLVLGNIASAPNRIRWSAFNNAELWTPSLSTQADFQDLLGKGGDVQGIVPGQYGVVFQEQSIWRMDYVGPPVVFRLDEVQVNRGTPAPKSIVHHGAAVYFYDWDGFYLFNGRDCTPIGHEKVDAWFERNCGNVQSLQGAVDRNNRIVMWGFKSSSASTYNDRVLMYNYGVGKWSYGEVTTEWICERRTAALTLDQLNTPLPDGVDLDSIDMDGKAFGGELTFQAFNSLHQACTFEGDPLSATVETKELAFDEHRADTNACMPLVDGGDATVRFVQRNTQATSPTYSNAISLNRIGEACKVVTGRYQRFELHVVGGFDFIRGVDIRSRKAGRR